MPIINLFKDMKRNSLTIEEIKKGLDAYLNIEADSSYLQSLREQIAEAEDKNSKLQLEIKEKINIITAFSSEILSIQKVKNSLMLQLRLAQEKMRNILFINGGFNKIPFQRP